MPSWQVIRWTSPFYILLVTHCPSWILWLIVIFVLLEQY